MGTVATATGYRFDDAQREVDGKNAVYSVQRRLFCRTRRWKPLQHSDQRRLLK